MFVALQCTFRFLDIPVVQLMRTLQTQFTAILCNLYVPLMNFWIALLRSVWYGLLWFGVVEFGLVFSMDEFGLVWWSLV